MDFPPGVDIFTTPAARPPPGVRPDFNSPVNSASLFYGISSVGMALAIIFVGIKLYVRLYIHRKPGIDDICTVLALILQIAYTAIVDNLFINGGARHQWDMPIAKFLWILSVQNKLGIIQMPTYLMTKLALLLLFYRIFSPKAVYKWAIIVGCVILVLAYIPAMFIFIFAGSRSVLIPTSYGIACINLITDVYIFVLPMMAVNSLHLPLARKIGVGAIFAAGLLACVMSAIALYYRFQIMQGIASIDQTYEFSARTAVLVVEIYVGIMVGCFPVLPSLFRKTSPSTFFSEAFKSLRSRLLSSREASTKSSGSQFHDSYPLSSRDKAVSLDSSHQV
jgi:hypothetical protein